MKLSALLIIAAYMVGATTAYDYHKEFHNQDPMVNIEQESASDLQKMWGQEWAFNGIQTYAHLPHTKCLIDQETKYDVALIGVPFDTATSYRPGARFGPSAIRTGSQRQNQMRSFNFRAGFNPYNDAMTVLDCGDIPISPMDNMLALKQMTLAFEQLYNKSSALNADKPPVHIALGGDHSIVLPHLRAVHKAYGDKIAVIHFDAHLDTWLPDKYPSYWHSEQSEFTHGSMLWMAHEEGLITDDQNLHIGIRSRLGDFTDYEEDDDSGFARVDADDVWIKGVDYAVQTALTRIGKDTPVFISVDIDVLDPAAAPGTGTIEAGGLLPRELIYILRRLENLNIVGADIVEVSPAYDSADVTATNAAQVVYELITSVVKKAAGKTKSEGTTLAKESGQRVLQAAKNVIKNY